MSSVASSMANGTIEIEVLQQLIREQLHDKVRVEPIKLVRFVIDIDLSIVSAALGIVKSLAMLGVSLATLMLRIFMLACAEPLHLLACLACAVMATCVALLPD